MGLKYVTGTVYFHSRNAEKFLGETLIVSSWEPFGTLLCETETVFA